MPDQCPLPEYIANVPRSARPRFETALSLYLRTHGITRAQFAELVGSNEVSVSAWANGQTLPSLISAFKVERATRGAVPVASWLGTQLGRWTWEGRRGPGVQPVQDPSGDGNG